jgi:hypothetical protein
MFALSLPIIQAPSTPPDARYYASTNHNTRGMEQSTFDSYFSQTMTTPAMMATGAMTPPANDSVPTTIKMEDLQVPYSTPSPAPSSPHDDMSQSPSTPGPGDSQGKPTKKRKSWGQVLPEPKTSLPPRKRAKTEDEKEQRRIERVKRNRLAAHNSRERKRQEYEVLQTEKDQMEADLRAYKERTAKLEAELKFFRSKYPGEVPETTFDFTPSTTVDDTICPARTSTSTSFPSPMSMSMDSLDSPRGSSCQPETPASSFEAPTPEFDSTQYPAAILCDLPCQSDSGTTPVGSLSPQLAATFVYLTMFNLTLQSTRSLLSSTTFSNLTSSQRALQSWNPLSAWLTLMSISLARPSSATAPTQPLLAFLTALMQSSLTCRVPLAHLTVATRPSQRSSSVDAVGERSSKGMSRAGPVDGDGHGSRLTKSSKLRQVGRRRRVSTLNRGYRRSMNTSLGSENLWRVFTRRRTAS